MTVREKRSLKAERDGSDCIEKTRDGMREDSQRVALSVGVAILPGQCDRFGAVKGSPNFMNKMR